jgi:hypothetical protein
MQLRCKIALDQHRPQQRARRRLVHLPIQPSDHGKNLFIPGIMANHNPTPSFEQTTPTMRNQARASQHAQPALQSQDSRKLK